MLFSGPSVEDINTYLASIGQRTFAELRRDVTAGVHTWFQAWQRDPQVDERSRQPSVDTRLWQLPEYPQLQQDFSVELQNQLVDKLTRSIAPAIFGDMRALASMSTCERILTDNSLPDPAARREAWLRLLQKDTPDPPWNEAMFVNRAIVELQLVLGQATVNARTSTADDLYDRRLPEPSAQDNSAKQKSGPSSEPQLQRQPHRKPEPKHTAVDVMEDYETPAASQASAATPASAVTRTSPAHLNASRLRKGSAVGTDRR